MAELELVRFTLDSEVCVTDEEELRRWILEQVGKRRTEYEYLPASENVKLGSSSEGLVISRDNPDVVFHIDDLDSMLQMVATLIIKSVPGLEDPDSYWEVKRDTMPGGSHIDTFLFKLASNVRIEDERAVFVWIIQQIDQRAAEFEYVEGWENEELGVIPREVVQGP